MNLLHSGAGDNTIIEECHMKQYMKRKCEANNMSTILNSTWQGLIYQSRVDDEFLVKGACFN